MNTKQKIEAVNSVLCPKSFGFISSTEAKMVERILEIGNIETREKLVALRNSVVKFYRPILDSIRQKEQELHTDLGFMVAHDKFSAILGVIDEQFAWRGWTTSGWM